MQLQKRHLSNINYSILILKHSAGFIWLQKRDRLVLVLLLGTYMAETPQTRRIVDELPPLYPLLPFPQPPLSFSFRLYVSDSLDHVNQFSIIHFQGEE
jgi:hypothetical protein